MKKIIVVSNYFPPEIGAASNRVFQMCDSLTKFNFDIEVICPFPNYPTGKVFEGYKGFYISEFLKKVKIHRFFIYSDNSKNIIKRAVSMLSFAVSFWLVLFKTNLKEIDCVIIQNSPLVVSFSAILLFKKILKKNIILNVSDLWPQSAIDLGVMKKESFSHKLLKNIEKFNYKNSDKFLAQSTEIIKHISGFCKSSYFHYRNIPNIKTKKIFNSKFKKTTFLYAGLLGVAQGIFSLIKQLDLIHGDFEFHIYGDGNEKKLIQDYLALNPNSKTKYFGSISKSKLQQKMSSYHFAFAPLATEIKGAFPSKIYELIIFKVPVIYIGSGSAKEFIKHNNIGYVVPPRSIKSLRSVVKKTINLNNKDYEKLLYNCSKLSERAINYQVQIKKLYNFINE